MPHGQRIDLRLFLHVVEHDQRMPGRCHFVETAQCGFG
jgi:hypothetical protein